MKKIVVLVLSSIAVLTASLANVASAQRSVTIIDDCNGSSELNNIAEITADNDVDVDSTPNNYPGPGTDNEDDVAQDCTTISALIDLELSKTMSLNETLDSICVNANPNPRKSSQFCDGGDPFTGAKDGIVFCTDVIVYTLTLTNNGPSPASADDVNAIVVKDYLPDDFDVDVGSLPNGADFDDVTNIVTWSIETNLNKDASVTLDIKGTVNC